VKGTQEPYPTEIQAIRRMPYGIRGFRRFAKLLGLKIHPFQGHLLRFYFAGVTELVILIPKKNGKTTLMAALAMYHLLMVPQAEAVIGAASKEQAALLHRQATLLIEAAGLDRRALPYEYGQRAGPTRYEGVFEIREGMHVIRFEMGRLRVMPHEARTGDGVIPTLALVDELHRHPTGELYEVWRDGLLGSAQMVTISTAGSDMESPLGLLLTKAREFEAEKTKRRSTYTSPDGSFVLVEWALDIEDDFHDMRTVKTVNPAPWHTIGTLRRRHDSPSTSPGQWLRFACGIWTAGDEPEILPADWDVLRADIGKVVDGDWVVLAPSVGHNAVIGIAAIRPDGKMAVRAEHLEPGGSIMARTEDLIVELCERYDVRKVLDPGYGMQRSMQLVEARGVPVEGAPYSTPRQIAATGTFDRFLRSGDLIHDGDPKTRAHVLAAIKKVGMMGEHYMASDQTRAIVAIAQAVHSASAISPTPMVVMPSGGVG
jgi:phage terminase large subunit-like protein